MKLSLGVPTKESGEADVSVGLDIGHDYIKLVVLKKENGQIYLDDFCLEGVFGNVSNELKNIVNKCDISSSDVNISLSGKSIIIRNLWLPIMGREELKKNLQYELDQYIPFPPEEVYYDAYIFGESQLTRKENKMRVVLAAAMKKYVEEKIGILKEAGINLNVIDMDAISLFNIFSAGRKDDSTVALIDIGSNKVIIDILAGDVLTFTREVELGFSPAKSAMLPRLTVGSDEKESPAAVDDLQADSYIQDLAKRISKEVSSSFKYYEGHEQRSVERVYVTGGGSLFKGLVDMLKQDIGESVEVWSPFENIKFSEGIDAKTIKDLETYAPLFSVSAGLAYRSLK